MTLILGLVDSPAVERVSSREELSKRALAALERDEPVLIVADGAWGIYSELRGEADRRSLNWLLLEALDPREAEAAGVGLEQMIAARLTLLNYEGRASAPLVPVLDKRVSRRELLRSLGTAILSHRDTVEVLDESLCAMPGCPRCIQACPYAAIEYEEGRARIDDRACRGCGTCISACPHGVLAKHSARPQLLWDYLLMLRGAPGLVVYACRSSLADLVEKLPLPTRAVILPVNCPGDASLEALLAPHLLGLRPVIYCPGAAGECGRKGVEYYASRVLESYMAVTGDEEPPVAATPEELASMPPAQPLLEPWEQPPVDLREAARLAASRLLEARGVEYAELRVPLQARLEVSDSCTLCGACVYKCPGRALSIDEEGGYSRLVQAPQRCRGCMACAAVCPERAVKAVYAALAKRTPIVLHEDEVVRCRVCGRPVGPKHLIEKTAEMLRRRGAPEALIETLYLCEECRKKKALGLLNLDEHRRRGA